MAYEQDRIPGTPADQRYDSGQEPRPASAAGNTGTIAVILAIVALFLGVLFFSGGAEQAVIPDGTLPSAPTTGAPEVAPSAPVGTTTAPVDPAPASPTPAVPAPAN